jgi:hypothetical protein
VDGRGCYIEIRRRERSVGVRAHGATTGTNRKTLADCGVS